MKIFNMYLLGLAAMGVSGLQGDPRITGSDSNHTRIHQQKQQELEQAHTKKLYHALKTGDATLIRKVLQESPEQFELQAARVTELRDAEYAQSRTREMLYGVGGTVLFAVVFVVLQKILIDKSMKSHMRDLQKEQQAVMGQFQPIALAPNTPHQRRAPSSSQLIDGGSVDGSAVPSPAHAASSGPTVVGGRVVHNPNSPI